MSHKKSLEKFRTVLVHKGFPKWVNAKVIIGIQHNKLASAHSWDILNAKDCFVGQVLLWVMEAMDSFYWVCWHKSTAAAACSQAESSGPAGHWHPPAPPSSTFHQKITFPFVKKAKNPPVRLPYTFHMATPHTTTESVQQTNSVIMLGKTIGSRSVSYHHSPMLWLLHLSSQYLSQQSSQGAIIGNTNWMLNCANCEVKYSWEVLWEGENVQAPPLTILPVARSKLIIGLNFTVLSISSVKKTSTLLESADFASSFRWLLGVVVIIRLDGF